MVPLFIVYYLVAVLGVNLGYHRMLSHRSVRLSKWLARLCVVCGLPAGTPLQWAGNHRFHHANADTPNDPHSPADGFWHAHCGWYFGMPDWLAILYAAAGPVRMIVDAWLRPRNGNSHNHLAGDVASDPFYATLSRPAVYNIAMHLYCFVATGIPVYLWGWAGLGFAWLTVATLYNLGDMIDSVAHDRQGPVNRPWLALLTAGEGWHIEHHRAPGSAHHGFNPGQFDLTWMIIRCLETAGWAKVEQVYGRR